MTLEDLRAQGYHALKHVRRDGAVYFAIHDVSGKDTGAYGGTEEEAWAELAWVLNAWR